MPLTESTYHVNLTMRDGTFGRTGRRRSRGDRGRASGLVLRPDQVTPFAGPSTPSS